MSKQQTKKTLSAWYKKEVVINNTTTETIVRRSPRNLPPHLKPAEEKQPEKEPEIESLPEIVFPGRISYVDNFHDCASICDELIQEIEKNSADIVPIGFDLEWPFSFQTGSGKTALAQICSSEKICYLFHLYDLRKLPAALVVLLSHPKVILVGVNIKNDVWKLGRDFPEFPASKVVENNCCDCGPYANTILKRSCRWSLLRLTAYVLQKKISKDPKVRNSKWHIRPLSHEQKLYAATDAYISLLLYLTLKERKEQAALENDSEISLH